MNPALKQKKAWLPLIALTCAAVSLIGNNEEAKAAGKTGLQAQYIVRVEWKDLAQWQTKTEGECEVSESSGYHEINSDSKGAELTPYAWTFTRPITGGLDVQGYYSKSGGQYGTFQEMKQKGVINQDNDTKETSKGCPEPEPIICEDCNSEDPPPPPQKSCGEREFTLTLQPPVGVGGNKKNFNFALNPMIEPEDPYYDETGLKFCYTHAAHPLPELWALEAKESMVSVPQSKALKYFSLSRKDRKACRKFTVYNKDRCKTNFTVKLKQGATFTREAPDYYRGTQESVLNLTFWFSGICTEKVGRKGLEKACYWREDKWKKRGALPGTPTGQ